MDWVTVKAELLVPTSGLRHTGGREPLTLPWPALCSHCAQWINGGPEPGGLSG